MVHIRQSRPDYGLDFQVQVLKSCQLVPFSLGSGSSKTTQTIRHGGAMARLVAKGASITEVLPLPDTTAWEYGNTASTKVLPLPGKYYKSTISAWEYLSLSRLLLEREDAVLLFRGDLLHAQLRYLACKTVTASIRQSRPV